MIRLALRPCRHGSQRMPGRQAAQRIEKPSRGSQRAISDTQEPQEERWREEEKIVDMGERKRENEDRNMR